MKKDLQKLIVAFLVFLIGNQMSAQLFDPLKEATGVGTSPQLSITFNVGDIVSFNTNKNLYLYDVSGSPAAKLYTFYTGGVDDFGDPIPGDSRLVLSGNVLTINLSSVTLDYSKKYRVYSDVGAISVNAIIWDGLRVSPFWQFTTQAAPVPPSVITYTPTQGASNVAAIQTLSVVFNEGVTLTTNESLYLKIRRYSDDVTLNTIDKSGVTVNGGTLTVTTHTDFLEDTKYYVTIDAGFVKSALSGANYGGISNKDVWSFTSEKVRIWKGSESTAFSDALNWEGGKAFIDGAAVTIPSGKTFYPIMAGTATMSDLVIESGGAFTVASSGNLTINGKLELKSLADNNADFVCLGTLNYTPSKTFIHQNIESPNRSYYVSSPVVGATQTSIGSTGQMSLWDPNTGTYALLPSSSEMGAGDGFVLKSSQSLLFNGALNIGDVSKIIYRTSNNAGWNLVGNPYPCAVDWRYVTKSTEVLPTFWIYRNILNIYATYNDALGSGTDLVDGRNIPSNQAFWAKVRQEYPAPSTGLLTFTNSSKSSANGTYLKAATNAPLYPILKLASSNGSVNNEIVVGFANGATTGYDVYDSEKYFSTNTSIAQPFMPLAGKNLCINTYPSLQGELIVPLGLRVGTVGDYSLDRISIDNFDESVQIYIDDLQEKTTVDLRNVISYPFTLTSTGDLTTRFQLRFVGTITTGTTPEIVNKSDFIVSVEGRTIFVNFVAPVAANIALFDLTGKQIMTKTIINGYAAEFDVLSNGIYLLKANYGGKVLTQKVLVK